MKRICLALLALLASTPLLAAGDSHGALAVDRAEQFHYGFSYDHASGPAASERALQECAKNSPNCAIVMRFSGKGCVAYATVPADKGDAAGWGSGKTKALARQQARAACEKDSAGQACSHNVWACNGSGSSKLRVEPDAAVQQGT
jgi:hypothetical protein